MTGPLESGMVAWWRALQMKGFMGVGAGSRAHVDMVRFFFFGQLAEKTPNFGAGQNRLAH